MIYQFELYRDSVDTKLQNVFQKIRIAKFDITKSNKIEQNRTV